MIYLFQHIFVKENISYSTMLNMTETLQRLLVMFWISALNGIFSPGTYPDLSNLIDPEIGPDLQHKQQRNFSSKLSTPFCIKSFFSVDIVILNPEKVDK